MKKIFIASVLFLSACGTPPEKQHAMDIESCIGYGFKEGTKDYANCMMALDQNRKAQAIQGQQADAMNAAASGSLLSGISSYHHSNGINCSTSKISNHSSINCY